MEKTHILELRTELLRGTELQPGTDLPLHVGAGAVNPELIEPVGIDVFDIEDVLHFASL